MNTNQRGYIALLSVLIISAVALAISSTVSLLGIGAAQNSLALSKGENSLQLAEGCANDALLKAQQSGTYNGGTITRPEGTCIITVIKNGNNWTIIATSTQNDYNRTVQVKFTRLAGSSITMNSWQEILPFATPTPTNTPTPTPTNTPTPTPTPTNTPTPTPTPTPAILATDTFIRANQTYWGKASDGNTWGGSVNSVVDFTIKNNTGEESTGGGTFLGTLGNATNNEESYATMKSNVLDSNNNIGLIVRQTDASNYYTAYIDGSHLIILKRVSGNDTVLNSTNFSASTNTLYALRLRVVGSTLYAKAWLASSSEPGAWTAQVSDSSLSRAGQAGIRTDLPSNTEVANYTYFQAKKY